MIGLKNLTGHTIEINAENGDLKLVLEPDPDPPFWSMQVKQVDLMTIPGSSVTVPVVKLVPDKPEGMPDPEDGVLLIVTDSLARSAPKPMAG